MRGLKNGGDRSGEDMFGGNLSEIYRLRNEGEGLGLGLVFTPLAVGSRRDAKHQIHKTTRCDQNIPCSSKAKLIQKESRGRSYARWHAG